MTVFTFLRSAVRHLKDRAGVIREEAGDISENGCQSVVNGCGKGNFIRIYPVLKRYTPMAAYADEVLNMGSYKTIAKTKYVNDKQITDHYAIIPTGQGMGALRGLSEIAANVYEIICRRFLSIFYPAAEYQTVKLVVAVGEENFCRCKALKAPGFLEIAGRKQEEEKEGSNKEDNEETDSPGLLELADQLTKGQELPVNGYSLKEGSTKPPKRYTSGSMVLAMENAGQLIEDEELRAQIKGSGIGTSATRAEIIKKTGAHRLPALE